MKKVLIVMMCLMAGGAVMAEAPAYVEGALVDGGENGRNGVADSRGFEVTGGLGFGEHWYVGGVLGQFTRDRDTEDIDNTYINIHGGRAYDISESTTVFGDLGIWYGKEEVGNEDTKPTAFEIKVGVNHSLSEKIAVFSTLAWVNGDLDTENNSNLRNYVWSLGISYGIGEHWALNLKLVNGVNGVNGQDQVIRFGGRYTF